MSVCRMCTQASSPAPFWRRHPQTYPVIKLPQTVRSKTADASDLCFSIHSLGIFFIKTHRGMINLRKEPVLHALLPLGQPSKSMSLGSGVSPRQHTETS
jgi:hypothetical protein